MRLFHYWRSSSSWRVRWALAYKGLSAEMVHVDLLNGEVESPEHLKRNPMGYVPVLEVDGNFLTESLAIIRYLEDSTIGASVFPTDPWERAHVWSLCEIINAGTQPLQNLNAMFLHSEDPVKRKEWAVYWIKSGLSAFDKVCASRAGKFCFGDTLTAADMCLIPQVYNALRNDIDIEREFPRLAEIYKVALATPSGSASHPDRYAPQSRT